MYYVVGAGGLDAWLPRNHRVKVTYFVLGEHLWVVRSFLCSARAYILKSPWNASAWILWITVNQPPVSLLPRKSGNTWCCSACLCALGFVVGCKQLMWAPRAALPRGFWSNPCCCPDMPYGGLGAGSGEALRCWYDGIARVDESFSSCIKGSWQGLASFALRTGAFALCRRCCCELSFSCAFTPKRNDAVDTEEGQMFVDGKKAQKRWRQIVVKLNAIIPSLKQTNKKYLWPLWNRFPTMLN